MTFVHISTEVETWVTRERDPEDAWDSGDTGGQVSNVTAWISDADKESGWYTSDSIVKQFPDEVQAGTRLYAVVADYSSGSTFGREGGYAQVLDAFQTMEEALALQTEALKTQSTDSWRQDYEYDFEYNGKTYHRAWAGYFECLNSLDIWDITVQSQAVNFLNPGPQAGIKHGR